MARLPAEFPVSEIQQKLREKLTTASHLICLIFSLKLSEIALYVLCIGVDPLFLEPDCYILRWLRFIIYKSHWSQSYCSTSPKQIVISCDVSPCHLYPGASSTLSCGRSSVLAPAYQPSQWRRQRRPTMPCWGIIHPSTTRGRSHPLSLAFGVFFGRGW